MQDVLSVSPPPSPLLHPLSQTLPYQFLLSSAWSALTLKGQLSILMPWAACWCSYCSRGILVFWLSIAQLGFSYKMSHMRLLVPSPSMSSSQMSGILSRSISHLYLEISQHLSRPTTVTVALVGKMSQLLRVRLHCTVYCHATR